MYNGGGFYDPETSHFQCPVSGVYYISSAFMKNGGSPLILGVDKSSITVLHNEDAQPAIIWSQVSNSRLIRCYEGETITVKATGPGAVDGGPNEQRTTFSVVLFSEDNYYSK